MWKLFSIRMSVSMQPPTVFSIRIATSDDGDVHWFRKVERAALGPASRKP